MRGRLLPTPERGSTDAITVLSLVALVMSRNPISHFGEACSRRSSAKEWLRLSCPVCATDQYRPVSSHGFEKRRNSQIIDRIPSRASPAISRDFVDRLGRKEVWTERFLASWIAATNAKLCWRNISCEWILSHEFAPGWKQFLSPKLQHASDLPAKIHLPKSRWHMVSVIKKSFCSRRAWRSPLGKSAVRR